MERLLTKWWYLVCILAAIISPSLCSNEDLPKCLSMWDTPGVTYPSGDIILRYGSPLEIFCVLTSKKYNISSLGFWRNDKPVPSQYVDIVNDTTIRMFIKEPQPSRETYYCRVLRKVELEPLITNTELVCLNIVIVDDEPKEVENVECTSYNWEKLVCSWAPQKYYVKKNYSLSYSPDGRTFYMCPENTKISKVMCMWNMSSSPQYLYAHRTLYFKMVIENTFGRSTKMFEINNYGIVIPKKPVGLRVVQAGVDSLTITWNWPMALHNFPPGLISKVIYKSQWDSKNYWDEVDTSLVPTNMTNVTLTISGLKYAHALYDIRLFLRSAASQEPYKWSEPATLTQHTAATVPSRPPKTDIGSYKVLNQHSDRRDLLIYWQRIRRYFENGDHFHYKVVEVTENGIKRDIKPRKVTNLYARFDELLSSSNYTFRIVSSNSLGNSLDFSEVFVPTLENRPPEPEYFTKIAFDQGLYELSWMAPVNVTNIESYTLFWCENSRDKPLDCTGELNWIRVFKHETVKNISLSEVLNYHFSISANTNTTSSGMVWASCTLLLRKDVIRNIKGISMNKVGSDFIEVNWIIDCTFRLEIIQNFVIYYCPIVSPYNLTCREPEQNSTVAAKYDQETYNHIFTNVTGLKPYTTYMISLAIQTKNWISRSYPHFNTTLEAAPDVPPRDVQIINKTNSSITLSWLPPEVLNGMLRQYKVFWGDSFSTVEDKTSVTLTNLDSFTQYNISVAACTIACSPNSSPILVQTDIGNPGRVNTPTLKFLNPMKISIYWEKPSKLYANSYYYEVRVLLEEDGQLVKENYFNLTEPPYNFEATDCRNADYNISIRAVNIDELNNKFYGPWSPGVIRICSSQKVSWVVIALICLALVLMSFIFLKWAYNCILKISSVEIVLPRLFEISTIKEKDIDNSFATHISQPHYPENLSCDLISTDQTSVQLMSDDECKKENEEHLEIEKCIDHDDTLKDDYNIYCSFNGDISTSTNETELLPFDFTPDNEAFQKSSDGCSNSGSEACLLRQRSVNGCGVIGGSGAGILSGGGIIGTVAGAGRGGYCQMGTTNGYVPAPPSWQLVPPPKQPLPPNTQPQQQLPAPPSSTTAPGAYCVLGIKPPSHTSQV